MRPISFQQKMEAIELYLKGLSSNEIVAKTGISKGAVVSILKDAREGEFPGLELKDRIDELHTLSARLKKEALGLAQARLGFTFLRRLLSIDIEPDKLREWIDFCSKICPTPPEGFIPAAMELLYIQRATGSSRSILFTKVFTSAFTMPFTIYSLPGSFIKLGHLDEGGIDQGGGYLNSRIKVKNYVLKKC